MVRFQAVVYDVTAASPAQPRVAALVRELAQRGHTVDLWTSRPLGSWLDETPKERRDAIDVRVVADPIFEFYRRLAGRSVDGRLLNFI